MKLNDVYKALDAAAPKALSDEYCRLFDAYDNSGLLIDTGKEVKTALFSLDFSLSAVKRAVEAGAELIVTHHPAIYGKIGEISRQTPLGEKIIECIERGISVASMHLNLDCAAGGTDESLMRAVKTATGGEANADAAYMHAVQGGGYGRAYALPQTTDLASLTSGLKRELNAVNVSVFGKTDAKLSRAASFCGGGASEEAIVFAVEHGADVIVSADFKHHLIADALERGLAVIAPTHYATENYGFKKYYEKISRSIGVNGLYHEDGALL